MVRAAFDGCERCCRERRAYRQAGDAMVCNFCGRASSVMRIGVDNGGCNPLPLEATEQGEQLLLRAATLDQGDAYF